MNFMNSPKSSRVLRQIIWSDTLKYVTATFHIWTIIFSWAWKLNTCISMTAVSIRHSVWKSQKKSHIILWAKRATFYVLSGQKIKKMPKMINFDDFLKSCSLTVLPDRYVNLIGQKFMKNAQIQMRHFEWLLKSSSVTKVINYKRTKICRKCHLSKVFLPSVKPKMTESWRYKN